MATHTPPLLPEGLQHSVVDKINVGVLVLDRHMRVAMWNRFMEHHSGRAAEEIVGRDLFECFPELPEKWLRKKIRSVFVLKNYAFTSWQQRPYLFRFRHNRTITCDVDFMYQDCTFIPLKGPEGGVEHVCITLFDMTDVYVYQNKLDEASATVETLETLSQRDGLTGVYNRRHIERQLELEFEKASRFGDAFSVLMTDIDHFKHINDTYGHLAGDEALRRMGRVMSDTLRDQDVVGRYGGEEFLVIMRSTGRQGALIAAEKLRAAVADGHVEHDGETLCWTTSVGVATFHPEVTRYAELLREADAALYAAKEGGRDRVCFHDGWGVREA
ncbi:MAG: diguanylate cyclase [Myxococcota bacterium]